MKGILEFDLTESEDRDEHLQAVNGWRYSLILYELDQHLRSIYRYEDKNDERTNMAEELREFLSDLTYEHGIKME